MKKQICFQVCVLGLLTSTLLACQTSNLHKNDSPPIEDFSLDENITKGADQTDGYYSDLEKSNASIPFKSSFPLSFSIAGTPSKFKSIPQQAHTPLASRLTVRMGDCLFFLKTGPVQVNRYLYTGSWVKFGEEISADSTIKLASMMDLNLKMTSQLHIEIPGRHQNQCRKLLYGRRTFIGWYHLNQSSVGLIQSPGTRPAGFQKTDSNVDGAKVYLFWHKGWSKPVLRNELEFPAVVESPIYRAHLSQNGFYYMSFHPVLRLKNINQLVIDIPLPDNNHNSRFQKQQVPISKQQATTQVTPKKSYQTSP